MIQFLIVGHMLFSVHSLINNIVIWIKYADGIVSIVDCLVEKNISFHESQPFHLSPLSAPLVVLIYNERKTVITEAI